LVFPYILSPGIRQEKVTLLRKTGQNVQKALATLAGLRVNPRRKTPRMRLVAISFFSTGRKGSRFIFCSTLQIFYSSEPYPILLLYFYFP